MIKSTDIGRRPSAEIAALLTVGTLPLSYLQRRSCSRHCTAAGILGALARDLVGAPSGETAILFWVRPGPITLGSLR